MDYNFITVPVITAIVYAVVDIIKSATNSNEKFLKLVPLVSAVLGAIIGIIAYYYVPGVLDTGNPFVALVTGGASGMAATGTNQIVKQLTKTSE